LEETTVTIRSILSVGAGAALCALFSTPAQAQPLGSFTWQLQAFCNKVTVSVTQDGGIYTLDGYDDQCGAAQRAPLVGMATPNPDGSIGFGLHIVTVPGGRAVQVDARITLPSLNGTWSDSAGNSGTMAFNGNAGGSARPAPTVPGTVIAVGTLPATAIANGAITTTQIANNTVTSINTSNEPGVSYEFNPNPLVLGAPVQNVLSTPMRVPANGYVKIEATGDWIATTAGTDSARCQLQKGAVAAIDPLQPRIWLNDHNTADGGQTGFSAHRILSVAVADNPALFTLGQSFRLVCDLQTGGVSFDNVHISATYYASSYEPIGFIIPFDTTAPPPPQ
jgi:hypothetical protein